MGSMLAGIPQGQSAAVAHPYALTALHPVGLLNEPYRKDASAGLSRCLVITVPASPRDDPRERRA